MDQGKIVEQGSYRDLMARGGAFTRLVQTQTAVTADISP